MAKQAALTVRISGDLKQRLQTRARRERRSLSAQIAHELASALDAESKGPRIATARTGRFLGLCKGAQVPTEADFREVRARLWGALPRSRRG